MFDSILQFFTLKIDKQEKKFSDSVLFHALVCQYALTGELKQEINDIRSVSTISDFSYGCLQKQLSEVLSKSKIETLQINNESLILDFETLSKLPVTLRTFDPIRFKVCDQFLLAEIGSKLAKQITTLKIDSDFHPQFY